MPERLGRVTGALQALEKPDFQSLLFRFAAKGFEEPLQLAAIGQVAGLKSVTDHDLAILTQLFWIGRLVDAKDGRDETMLKLARDRFVGREHEFFDQLMRLVVLDSLETERAAARLIDDHFHLRKIEIERTVRKAALAQKGGEFPGCVQ